MRSRVFADLRAYAKENPAAAAATTAQAQAATARRRRRRRRRIRTHRQTSGVRAAGTKNGEKTRAGGRGRGGCAAARGEAVAYYLYCNTRVRDAARWCTYRRVRGGGVFRRNGPRPLRCLSLALSLPTPPHPTPRERPPPTYRPRPTRPRARRTHVQRGADRTTTPPSCIDCVCASALGAPPRRGRPPSPARSRSRSPDAAPPAESRFITISISFSACIIIERFAVKYIFIFPLFRARANASERHIIMLCAVKCHMEITARREKSKRDKFIILYLLINITYL